MACVSPHDGKRPMTAKTIGGGIIFSFLMLVCAICFGATGRRVVECKQYLRFGDFINSTASLGRRSYRLAAVNADDVNQNANLLISPDNSSRLAPNNNSVSQLYGSLNVTDLALLSKILDTMPVANGSSHSSPTAAAVVEKVVIQPTQPNSSHHQNATKFVVVGMINELKDRIAALSDIRDPAKVDQITAMLGQLAVAQDIGKFTDQVHDGVAALSTLLQQFNSHDGVAIAKCCVQVMSILVAVTGPASIIVSAFGSIAAMMLGMFNTSPSMDAIILQAFDRARAREIGAEAYATMKVYTLSQAYLDAYRMQSGNISCQDAQALITNVPVLQGVELLGTLENFITSGSNDGAQVELIMGLGEFYVQLASIREALLMDMYQILHNNSASCPLPAATQGILNVIAASRELEHNLWRIFYLPDADFRQINLAASFRSDMYPMMTARMSAVRQSNELESIEKCLLQAKKIRNVHYTSYYAYTVRYSPRACWGVYKGDPGPQGYWHIEPTRRLIRASSIPSAFDNDGSSVWDDTTAASPAVSPNNTVIVEHPGGIYVRLSTEKWPDIYSTPRKQGWLCARQKFGAAVKFIPVRKNNDPVGVDDGNGTQSSTPSFSRRFVIAATEARMKYAYVTGQGWVGIWYGDPGQSAYWTVDTC